MKRLFALLLVLTMALSLAACGKKAADPQPEGTDTITDEAIDEIISNWMGEESICVYTKDPVTIGGYNYTLAFSIKAPGGMHAQAYDISLSFTLV